MSTENDVARSLRSWLRENRHEDANRVLDTVFDQVPATPQRSAGWLARRFRIMNSNFVRVALAAAAVVVVAIVGYQFLGNSNSGGPGATGTPQPTFTLEPSVAESSPSASVAGKPIPPVECAELEAGTYRVAIGDSSVTVSVPTGWKGSSDRDGFNLNSRGSCLLAGGVTLTVSLVSHVYSDACDWQGTAVETGTPAAVVAAFAAQTGHLTSAPSETTLGGYPATRFEFSLPKDFDDTTCDFDAGANQLRLWRSPGGGEGPGMYSFDGSGSFVTVYVVDVDGSALGIAVDSGVPDEPADLAELDAVVASLRIEPMR